MTKLQTFKNTLEPISDIERIIYVVFAFGISVPLTGWLCILLWSTPYLLVAPIITFAYGVGLLTLAVLCPSKIKEGR
jgi:hypothetical protein